MTSLFVVSKTTQSPSWSKSAALAANLSWKYPKLTEKWHSNLTKCFYIGQVTFSVSSSFCNVFVAINIAEWKNYNWNYLKALPFWLSNPSNFTMKVCAKKYRFNQKQPDWPLRYSQRWSDLIQKCFSSDSALFITWKSVNSADFFHVFWTNAEKRQISETPLLITDHLSDSNSGGNNFEDFCRMAKFKAVPLINLKTIFRFQNPNIRFLNLWKTSTPKTADQDSNFLSFSTKIVVLRRQQKEGKVNITCVRLFQQAESDWYCIKRNLGFLGKLFEASTKFASNFVHRYATILKNDGNNTAS